MYDPSESQNRTRWNVGSIIEEDGCATGQFEIVVSDRHIPLLLAQYHTTYILFDVLWEHCQSLEDLLQVTLSFDQFKEEARQEGIALLNFNDIILHETDPFFELELLDHATDQKILFRGINLIRPFLQIAKKFLTSQPLCLGGLN